MFLLQVVYSPAAERNMRTWRDTHWSYSSDATEVALTRSPCQYAQVHVHLVIGDHISCSMQRGDFWKERELDCGHSPG